MRQTEMRQKVDGLRKAVYSKGVNRGCPELGKVLRFVFVGLSFSGLLGIGREIQV